MIQGAVGQEIAITVNFLVSRAGLGTVGYTLMNNDHTVFRSRSTTGVVEVLSNEVNTGIYSAKIKITEPFIGYVLWDTGQPPAGVGANRLRTAVEEISIQSAFDESGGGGNVLGALIEIMDAIKALYEENTIKIADQTNPNTLRIIRKKPDDPNWSQPYADTTIPVIRRPGQFRYGGPLE